MKRADLPGFTYVFCKVKSLIQSDFLTKISWFAHFLGIYKSALLGLMGD